MNIVICSFLCVLKTTFHIIPIIKKPPEQIPRAVRLLDLGRGWLTELQSPGGEKHIAPTGAFSCGEWGGRPLPHYPAPRNPATGTDQHGSGSVPPPLGRGGDPGPHPVALTATLQLRPGNPTATPKMAGAMCADGNLRAPARRNPKPKHTPSARQPVTGQKWNRNREHKRSLKQSPGLAVWSTPDQPPPSSHNNIGLEAGEPQDWRTQQALLHNLPSSTMQRNMRDSVISTRGREGAERERTLRRTPQRQPHRAEAEHKKKSKKKKEDPENQSKEQSREAVHREEEQEEKTAHFQIYCLQLYRERYTVCSAFFPLGSNIEKGHQIAKTMEPSPKRSKPNTPDKKILIRLSDAFIRTDGKIICPVIKAQNSIRVLYKLDKDQLIAILRDVGLKTGLIYQRVDLKTCTAREIEGNLFIECLSFKSIVEKKKLDDYKSNLVSKLSEVSKVKDIVIDDVKDTNEFIPQPFISEVDFELHKLTLCSNELSDLSDESLAGGTAGLCIGSRDSRGSLTTGGVETAPWSGPDDFKGLDGRFRCIGTRRMGSANVSTGDGKGKSFILNLLMLLTADNEDEYRKNNEWLKLPQAIPQDTPIQMICETEVHLPDVVTVTFNESKSNASLKSLENIRNYFSEKKRLELEAYILPQKEIRGSYNSTTKCIIHLRYGMVYQMSVQYFDAKELQEQLFDLVAIDKEDKSSHINEDVNEKAQECLKARFKILTGQDYNAKGVGMAVFRSPEDIVLSGEVMQFAGKTELHFGKGKNSAQERLALQAILKDLTIAQEEDGKEPITKIAAVKKIVVYLPSKILHGGKEILEMPGTDDSDPMAMDFIRNALEEVDAVILITDFSFNLAEKEVKDMLSNSGFLKRFKENPRDYKLMLLTYPEKDLNFQFGENDITKIKKLEQEGIKKRTEELNSMKKLFKQDLLNQDVEHNIITMYTLPVLYTSILSQQELEHTVLTKHEYFLNKTGIFSLIGHLDEFVASKHNSSFKEVQTWLSDFQQEINEGMRAHDAKSIILLLKNNEFKATYEQEIFTNHQRLAATLKKDIESLFLPTSVISEKIKEILEATLQLAKARWKVDKNKVTSISLYNPQFSGRHHTFKVRLFYTFFEDLEEKKTELSHFIKDQIEVCLQKYKEKAISQCSQDLNKLLSYLDRNTVSSDFVRKIGSTNMDIALGWYEGKTKRPFNRKKIEENFRMSQQESLKNVILRPNFNNNTVANAKIQTEKKFEECIERVEEFFIPMLRKLHEHSWKRMKNKLFMPNGSYKMWQQVIQSIKTLAKDSEGDNHREQIAKLNIMMSETITKPQ
ncbi:Hypothetical predicted protein [Pelobates cultripes]|uniref:Uncharacterized protein n=1 Tax=Pelobates cultripes TaxID=61616 RepID=A0AAD1W8N2_PELCU|nr:Hypothetical predicted protein [Pelobates cultripes]